MISSKYIAVLCLCFLSVFHLTNTQLAASNSKDIACEKERPSVCSDIYSPVCANYPRMCITSPCLQYQEFSNACEACRDINVNSYRVGSCSDSTNQGAEQSLNSGEFGFEGEDVLGLEEEYLSNKADEYLHSTEESSLLAGEELIVTEPVQSGPTVTLCPDNKLQVCVESFSPVCSFGCRDGDCGKSYDSYCSACNDPNVISYTQGECTVPEPQKTYCDPAAFAATDIACTMDYTPVCSSSAGCNDISCRKTSSNACIACNFDKAEYYVDGACGGNAIIFDSETNY